MNAETAGARTSPAAAGWLQVSERGTALGMWFMVMVCRVLGRSAARLIVRVIVLYFVAFAPAARRASRDYLRRLGRPHDLRAVLAHFRCFANCTLDRLFWVGGRTSSFQVTCTGVEHLEALQARKRGAILLGAHLGSFEAMRAMADRQDLPINIVGHFKNARLVNGVLERLNPGAKTRVLAVEPGVDFVLKLKERVDAGELVALLADRVGLGDRVVEVQLMGAPVQLPAGPYWLAGVLGCPVYLTFGLYHEPDRYDLFCEPFAERVELRRGARQEEARRYAQRYATRLEHYAALAPDNWFNFYDYWRSAA